MIKYIAFLRGINVGGHKILKMKDLNATFAEMGFENVKTFIQTGNVVFDSTQSESIELIETIKNKINDCFGFDVTVILTTVDKIKHLISQKPFVEMTGNIKMYATLLAGKPVNNPILPFSSPKGDIEVFAIENNIVLSIGKESKGRYGFPNGLIEKEFGVLATTRNWNTICKLIK
jgi:uncharacterized protein (DUF1697 family)